MNDLLVCNGTIVTPAGPVRGDLAAAGGRIMAVGGTLEKPSPGAAVVDATGCFVLPGGIDPHVHLSLPTPAGPSRDDFESGSLAALAGGTTTFIDFVTPARGESLLAALAERRAEAARSACDHALHMSVTGWNAATAEEMARCVEEGATSFKTYMAYRQTVGIDDADLLLVMKAAARLGALVTVHCELGDVVDALRARLVAEGKGEPRFHPTSRPPEVEAEAVQRAVLLAREAGCRLYVVHVSTAEGAAAIAAARAEGQAVDGETCPHYLLLDDRRYDAEPREAAKYTMSPPLRPARHLDALWAAVAGGALQTVATDHCPFDLAGQKDAGLADFTRIPNGVAGLQDRLKLLYTFGVATGRLTWERFAELTAAAPARIFGLWPRKGALAVGADADLAVWDPKSEEVLSVKTSLHRCDTSLYEGFRVRGGPRAVAQRGRVVFEDGRLSAAAGDGLYLKRGLGASA